MSERFRMTIERHPHLMGAKFVSLDLFTHFDQAVICARNGDDFRAIKPHPPHHSRIEFKADLGTEGMADALRRLADYVEANC